MSIDTTAAFCAAAIVSGNHVLARRCDPMPKGQAEHLFPMISSLFRKAKTELTCLDGIVVACGPGNFTGIRIGVAATRGLAASLGIPAIGIGNLHVLAFGYPGRVLTTADAKGGLIYAQIFHGNLPTGVPKLCSAPDLKDFIGKVDICVGYDAENIAETLEAEADTATAGPEKICLASQKLDWLIQNKPKPIYIRPADADLPAQSAPKIVA